MKIYEIGTGYTPIPAQMGAATEIVVEELTKAFLKLGETVRIIDIEAEDRADTELPIIEVSVPKCFQGTDVKLGLMHKLKRVVYSVCLAFTLRRLLKNSQEKVVLHFHNQYNMFFFLLLTGKKLRQKALCAYTNHSGIWRMPWEEIATTIRKRYFQEAECMKRADVVFLLNEETKRNVMEYLAVPEERLVLVGNGVNTDVYHPLTEEQKQAAREKWGLQNCRVILQVGSVYENKGQLRAVECLLPLLKQHPELVYVYAGGIVDPQYQARVEAFVQKHGLQRQIRYLGMLSPGKEVNELYNAANTVVCISQYEAGSLAVLEALSAGVPVTLEKNSLYSLGMGCIHLEETNREYWLAAISEDAGRQLSCQARKNTVENFSWDKIASDYYREFENRMKTNG